MAAAIKHKSFLGAHCTASTEEVPIALCGEITFAPAHTSLCVDMAVNPRILVQEPSNGPVELQPIKGSMHVLVTTILVKFTS